MSITTYAELKSSISSWLNRDNLTAVIPDFISLAEAGINRDLRHYKMVNRVDATLDSRYVQVPDDWLETLRFSLTTDGTRPLEMASLDDMIKYRQDNSNGTGTPKFYSHVGESIEVFPTPDGEYGMQLMYYQSIPDLTDTNTYNWLIQDAPDVYLYGALVQSAPYLEDDARTQTWAALYSAAMLSLQKASDDTRFAGSGLRMRVTSY